ncbi:aldehyde dehydrogenase family protein [Marinobacter zhejiangensis]|uniref:Acyl-CoA reductase n=1 Tax=Marinobacter zhejiangensis TaxID=488535 RepID=A0A1I4LLE4_9GAMM|nr:aldehyde dehydrogenase family protein [Marinobacter zhejiangensis]SFL91711.1 Acyl-CoA reductase [Marinobacter zhejiangensis]
MQNFRLLINGRLVPARETIEVINPADESVLAHCPKASIEQLEQAVQAAKQAFPSWSRTPIAERRVQLILMANALQIHKEELALLLTGEQGKPLAQARAEVDYAQAFCRTIADMRLDSERLIDNDQQHVELQRRPLGVVAAITPWNFPLLIACYKIAPALLAGNTLVLKPAPTTPLATLKLGEAILNIFPPGVVNIITDNNDLGPVLTRHPDIRKVSFTGSTETGKAVMSSAAATLKRLTLELGGNDAALVLDDVDVASVAEGIFSAAFINSGQVCVAIKRVYVPDSIYDPFCDAIATLAANAVVGNGMNPASQYGPVQNRAQFDKVCGYLHEARRHGTIIAGGEVPDQPGFVIPLTVVRDIKDGNPVVDEEAFGPLLPIVRYSDLDQVVASLNRSPYGLGGSVWSSSLARAESVANQLDTGTVWINQHCAFGPHIPMPTTRASGIGVEWGQQGLEEFTTLKVINMNRTAAAGH